MNRLAICLYGHCRTFELTYQNFFKFLVDENKLDGYEVDIFFHTWDVYHDSFGSWHKHNSFFDKILLNETEKQKLYNIYKPKSFLIEYLPEGQHGTDISLDKVNTIREKYSKENKIHYEYILYTRMDVMFLYPFKINLFLQSYNHIELRNITPKDNEKFLFVANNAFTRFRILDPRYPNEGDLLWFSNFSSKKPHLESDCNIVFIDYRIHNHCYIARANILSEENIWRRIDEQQKHIEQCNALLRKKDLSLSFQTKYGTAKTRIQNQLSYKLGQAMIVNSKSFLGYIRMPIILLGIALLHKQEQKIYQEKIKKNYSLKLPPLENYPDYKEALKFKNHLSYRLGQALIRANKTWYGGGYIKFIFKDVPRLKRDKLKNIKI